MDLYIKRMEDALHQHILRGLKFLRSIMASFVKLPCAELPVDRDFYEEGQGNQGSVACMVRERDADRVAASNERSLRLSIKESEEPTHRLAFAGPRGDPTMEFEDLWGPRIHASFLEAMIAFTRSEFGISLIWQEWYTNACAIRRLHPQDPRAPKRGEIHSGILRRAAPQNLEGARASF